MPTLPTDGQAVPHVCLPAWPIDVVRNLTEQPIWLAGGPVRDLIIDRVPDDWDFVSDGGALQLARAIANAMGGAFYPLDTVRGTGRAIVLNPKTGAPMTLDFAELRGCRIEDDLQLRDFTINAIAATLDGHLIDPTVGRRDLARRSIRMTSPSVFQQDPVRLVRAVRQAVQLHFVVDPETSQQMRQDAAAISDVAAERVRAELVKMLRLPEATQGLFLLDEHTLLEQILPECRQTQSGGIPTGRVAPSSGRSPGLTRICRLIDTVDQLAAAATGDQHSPVFPPHPDLVAQMAPSIGTVLGDLALPLATYLSAPVGSELTHRDLLKWCMLFLTPGNSDPDAAVPTMFTAAWCSASASRAEQAMKRLRFSRAAVEFVATALGACWRFGQLVGAIPSRRQIYAYFRDTRHTGPATVMVSLASTAVRLAELGGNQQWHAQLDLAQVLLDAYLRQREVFVDPQPLLSGTDLMALGLDSGPRIGELIEALREAQATGEVSTRSEAHTWATRILATR